MSSPIPLLPDQIPDSLVHSLDFESQSVEFHKKSCERKMMITRTCLSCGNKERVPSGQIRATIKTGQFKGLCFSCATNSNLPDTPPGRKHHAWKGGRRMLGGYVQVYSPDHPFAPSNKYVMEHRLVMEKSLGRFLTSMETVHHKNGIRNDNRIVNLELRFGRHGKGQKYDDLSISQILDLITFLQGLIKNRTQSN